MNKQSEMVPVQASAEHGLAAVFGRLRNEIDQLFDDFSMPSQMRRLFPLPDGTNFSPLVELKDKQDHYELAIEVPGMEDKDIDVEFADGVLSISGEKREESEETSGGCLISERSYGSFQRRLGMPPDVDPEQIDAKFRQGVLKITIGKDKEAARRVRKIAVG
ncbi:Hsp20/alpha crystallin family protein [Erythrobacter sp. sf7]|uniref:Hsp20/alpha crystallin family protein n=1 Tax=Erythrobacter fulvus TaxID=2987523 RepID=A0ABT5JMZ2_9SPHN|nr:Hsp20/alpha crystallin family protein [Erythrobacter fulvus]MDC8753978.1 Hsp20/alpha crystallin family protein [Erythrobacter fulvus]